MNDKKIIAEIGSVHDGSFGNAQKLILQSAKSGANVVKFQLHLFDEESLPGAPNPSYFSGESRKHYFERTTFDFNQLCALKKTAEENNIEFLVSPFSVKAAEILEDVGVDSYKVPSGEITNLQLLKFISSTNKPVYLSTGMSNWEEIDRAVKILNRENLLTLMQCSSIYPCPNNQVGLNVVSEMIRKYQINVGFSDHTLGYSAGIAAATLGANCVEKHVTFSRNMYGSDAKNSMEFHEFTLFCEMLNDTWEMVSNPVYKDDLNTYKDMRMVFQKTIVASKDLKKGTIIDESMLNFKKPMIGIEAHNYKSLIGRRLNIQVKKDHVFTVNEFYEN